MPSNHFIESFFSKSVDELKIDDVKDFFSTPQEETATLEFKSGQVEIEDLYKEICAFLNTEGGLIILGSPKETKVLIGKTEKRVCQGDLSYSKFKSKDWLIQKFYSNIAPAPDGIAIREFLTDDGNIFLVEVAQSITPPHQSNSDGRYYIRMECEAKPAPHGLVQALFNKRKLPKLNAEIYVKKINENQNEIAVQITNEADIPADKVSFVMDVFNVENIESSNNFRKNIDPDQGLKYTFSQSTSQVLVRFIHISIELTVTHRSKNYVVAVVYYSRETDFNGKFFLINSKTGSVISEYKHFNDAVRLNDLIAEIQ